MKKLFLILTLFSGLFLTAQSTLPRWGAGPPQEDNTGRILPYVYGAVTTVSTTSLVSHLPNAWQTIYKIGTLTHALRDSLSTKKAYVGDKVIFVFTADTLTAGRVVTFGSGSVKSYSALTVPASKKATAQFIFDGAAWIEVSRTLMGN
jgi:hypothetical protein